MKRRLLKLGVFLLVLLAGGAIVNVAVAWGSVLLMNPFNPSVFWRVPAREIEGEYCHIWIVESFRSACGERFHSLWVKGAVVGGPSNNSEVSPSELVPPWANFARPNAPNAPNLSSELWVDARGWPTLCLWCGQITDANSELPLGTNAQRRSREFGFEAGIYTALNGVTKPRRVPTRILPLGFAINTIFYAAMLWLLWFAPGKIRRFIRVRRGRCPACGFIIAPGTAAASGGPCSECGQAPQPRRGVGV